MKAPVTDRTMGVVVGRFSDEKFADVRRKARDEYVLRGKKKKKDKSVNVPPYQIGDGVVFSSGYGKKEYHLIEIVDFYESRGSFYYYGILLKTTEKARKERIGRLIGTSGPWSLYGLKAENIPSNSIRWEDKQ